MDSNKLAKEWFDSAEGDFQYAEIGLKEDKVYPQTAFLAQQVAEKYLKGFLVLQGVKPIRSHELPMLLDECVKINPELEELRDVCEILSGFYVETRYPPDIPDFTKEDIQLAFDHAKMVRDKVKSLVESEGV